MKSRRRETSHSGARFSRINSGQAIPTYGTGQVPKGSGQVMATEKKLYSYEIEHDVPITQWDDYYCELLPNVGTSYLTVKNQNIIR